ncbi:hypothetical protein ABNX05_18200 [Lysinibacillus sp. M3]|uniref:DUF2479 domain-containing protein n=1 Tax=Lysinibacillus zambalensis TaxID=3160866 RepID=A0ABV1MVM4_9BACI
MTVKQPVNYLDFNNPIHIVWRKGTPNDPFVDRLDITRVVNQRVALLEIPDELYRVRIPNMFEINYEKFIKSTLGKNEFYCDYTNGFIYFHADKEAETVSIVYKGRGVILYPSNRIIHYDGTDSTETLFKIIEDSKTQIQELIGQTANFEEVLENMIVATNLTKEATDIVLNTNDKTLQYIELIKDAYETTVLIYQPYVQTQADIAKKYPNPKVGWTVQVYDSGIRYRFNGKEWIPIDNLGGNIPVATENYDGLMSKKDFVKLKEISVDTDTRTIVFIIPQEILQGVQDPHVVFPHSGKILEVKAYVSKTGTKPTNIEVQKSSDFVNWKSITGSPILIAPNKFKDNGYHTLTETVVSEGDVFRLRAVDYGIDTYNLTVNIKITIN